MINIKALIFIIFSFTIAKTNIAQVQDLKKLTPNNKNERTAILNVTRQLVKKEIFQNFEYKCDPKFIVEKLKVYKNYAWFSFVILDERGVELPDLDLWYYNKNKKNNSEKDEDYPGLDWNNGGDVFLKKTGNKWIVIDHLLFPTDPGWIEQIKTTHPELPEEIIPSYSASGLDVQ